MTPLLHIPVDFERREDVRRLSRAVGDKAFAAILVLRMWTDWATAAVEFRPLKGAIDSSGTYDWEKDELTFVIEDFCRYESNPGGELIKKAIEAGVLRIEERNGKHGLVLNDFWRFNSHLSPTHKTMQQKGAIAKHARQSEDGIRLAADHQVELIEGRGKQFALPLDAKATADEIKSCVGLIMMLDRACNKPMRKSAEYTQNESLMNSALQVVRRFSKEDIEAVHEYVIANRDNPRLGKIPERILERFGEHMGKAKDCVEA